MSFDFSFSETVIEFINRKATKLIIHLLCLLVKCYRLKKNEEFYKHFVQSAYIVCFSDDTLAKLEIYFKELIYEKMEQKAAYEVTMIQSL